MKPGKKKRNTPRVAANSFKALALAPIMFFSGMAGATVLTFDQIRLAGNVVPTISGNTVPQDYGDRVSAAIMDVSGGQFTYGNLGEGFTPNVLTAFFTGMATPLNPGTSLWVDSYGDLTNVLIGGNFSNSLNVRLSADAGFEVLLYGFDLGGWPNTDYTINAVRILDGTTPLFAQNNVLVQGDFSGPRRTVFDFLAPLSGADLLIEIDYSNLAGGLHDNIGIDNIRFGQTPPPDTTPPPPPPGPSPTPIPLPGTIPLFGLGALLLLRARRTRT
ncbi:MAG: hypothetical protein FJY56_02905 [Betaproteobacteria bacterium]|nr:hypothetical protein [Betaproteobacteria bacterium]